MPADQPVRVEAEERDAAAVDDRPKSADRPRLLDLCCKAGGAAEGYYRAGFEVIGVDIEPQPNYPFEFYQADVMTLELDLLDALWDFDAVHASPPCQRYIRGGTVDKSKAPDLLGPIRDRLEALRLPYVIENVPGAPMRPDVMLCGSMFGLPIRRHRWFESNVPLFALTPPCDHSRPIVGVYGHPHGDAGAWPGMLPGDLATWSRALDIDWMTAAELSQAIPPAYTQWIGEQLLDALAVAA